jgi:hypothetical protein
VGGDLDPEPIGILQPKHRFLLESCHWPLAGYLPLSQPALPEGQRALGNGKTYIGYMTGT